MWIFTSSAFLSIVEDQEDSRWLVVRTRLRGDIERLFPGAHIDEDGSDYRFRTWLRRSTVTRAIAGAIADIDYDNFKASIKDRRRHEPYLRIWIEMAALQREALMAENNPGKSQ
jgi:hypothetical protein